MSKTVLNTSAAALLLPILLTCLPSPAEATNEPETEQTAGVQQQILELQTQMQTMANRLEVLEQELARTRQKLAASRGDHGREYAADPVAPAHSVASSVSTAAGDDIDFKVRDGHLKVASREAGFEVGVGGRLQMDTAYFDADDNALGNGSELRRARLFVAGKFAGDWAYKNQIDFAGDDVAIKDAYLRYSGLGLPITIGNHKEPFSLEELTSSKYITFMERGMPNVFAPGRNLGLSAGIHGKPNDSSGWSAALGIFGEGIDDSGVDQDGLREDDEGVAVTGRFTYAPIVGERRLVHLGGALSFRDTGDGTDLRLRERFESHISDRRLVDTGTISGVRNLFRSGLELAASYGPASVQAEYMHATLSRRNGPDPDFSSYYVYGSWILTGESRAASYDTGDGDFGRLRPLRPVGKGAGAWELAARFSNLDMRDSGIDGGEEDNFTFGVNWYLTSNARLMANYVKVLDVDAGPTPGDEPEVFQIRAQVDF